MRYPLRIVLTTFLAIGVLLSSGIVDAARRPRKKQNNGFNAAVFAIPKEITLTPDQQTQLNDIKMQWGPKVVEGRKRLNAILTPEQRAAKKGAIAQANAANATRKARAKMVNDALNLSDAQQAQTKEVKAINAKQRVAIKHQIYSILTDDQRPYYKLPRAKQT